MQVPQHSPVLRPLVRWPVEMPEQDLAAHNFDGRYAMPTTMRSIVGISQPSDTEYESLMTGKH